MPTQLRAARDPGRGPAVFSEGSAGEYETKARKRRTAETNSRNPISSFRRRLLVGVQARENGFIVASSHLQARPHRHGQMPVTACPSGHPGHTYWKCANRARAGG